MLNISIKRTWAEKIPFAWRPYYAVQRNTGYTSGKHGESKMQVEIRNPYRLPFWICSGLGLACLAVGLGLIACLLQYEFQKKVKEALLVTSIFSLIGSAGLLVPALMLGLISRKTRQYVMAVQNGECLANWSYLPEEWAAFQVTESPQLVQDYYKTVVIPLLIGTPVGIVLLAVLFFSSPKPDTKRFMFTVIGIGIFDVLVLSVAYYTRVTRRRAWGNRQLTSPPRSYVHRRFVYANGDFVFGFFNQQLIDVQFLSGPPSQIEFTIKSIAPRVGEIIETRRALVPSGQDMQAHEVISVLREEWKLP